MTGKKIRWLATASAVTLLFFVIAAGDVYSRDDYSVRGFIDEDGDGFNDLLPDADGDGVPDGLDPDSDVGRPDSAYMHRYMHQFQEQRQMMWENMNGEMPGGHMEHGEPGMYGPGDSTMHGDHMGGGHHGGGGMGGGMDPGGGMGGSGGGMGPDSEGGVNPPPDEGGTPGQVIGESTPELQERAPIDQDRQPGNGNNQGSNISANNNPGGE